MITTISIPKRAMPINAIITAARVGGGNFSRAAAAASTSVSRSG
jgi:hypothetical protein